MTSLFSRLEAAPTDDIQGSRIHDAGFRIKELDSRSVSGMTEKSDVPPHLTPLPSRIGVPE